MATFTSAEELPPFVGDKHAKFIQVLAVKSAESKDRFEFAVTEYMRMSGVYWGLTAMALMGRDLRAEMGTDKLVEWVLSCQHPGGGFGGGPVGIDGRFGGT